MGVLNGVAQLRDEFQRLGGSEATCMHSLAEINPVDELHREEEVGRGLAEVMNGDDVGVVEFREDFDEKRLMKIFKKFKRLRACGALRARRPRSQ